MACHAADRIHSRHSTERASSVARRCTGGRCVRDGHRCHPREEEPRHLGRGVGSLGICVGAAGVAAEPGVAAAVHDPLLRHDDAVHTAVERPADAATAMAGVLGD